MKNLLIITGYYVPAYKAGGPVRSLVNFVDWFHSEFKIRIITSDRDLGDSQPYSHIETNIWIQTAKADIQYLSPEQFNIVQLYLHLKSIKYDAIYLNSYFSTLTIKTLLLLWLRLIPVCPVVLAPRGEFSSGALQLKSQKKLLYMRFANAIGLYSNLTWQASSAHEQADIRNALKKTWFRRNLRIRVAPNLPQYEEYCHIAEERPKKQTGFARLVFLSRISPKKNLCFALRLLSQIQDDVEFQIYGPIEDTIYWNECQKIISSLPSNINVSYKGVALPEQVKKIFASNHLLLLPTLGENFGHVILEALAAGCPVLISDQTPWRALQEKQVGWDLSLSNEESFKSALQELISMDESTFQIWSNSAAGYGKSYIEDSANVDKTRQMFMSALNLIT